MKLMLKVMCVLMCGALSVSTYAADGFLMDANANFLKTTGSSNKETLRGVFDLQYNKAPWAHLLHAEGLNEVDNRTNVRSAERYLVFEKSSRSFTDRDYFFVKPQWEKDLRSAFDYQTLATIGYGRKILMGPVLQLSTDVGAGSRHSKLAATSESDNETVGNAALKFEWKLTDTARFNEDASVEAGKNATITRTRSAVTVNMTAVLGLTLSYETKTDSSDDGVQDSLTAFGLSYRLR